MEDEGLENPTTTAAHEFSDDIDSCCSTPYVSAPSSPGRGTPLAGFYYSAPTSPTHFIISTTNVIKSHPYATAAGDANSSFEFDFSATFPSTGASSPESMTSADELFFNGQIRPMKLSTHLQRPQILAPLLESENDVVEEDDETLFSRGRDLKNLRAAGSLRRRTRSMSPLRSNASTSFQWREDDDVASKTENTEDDSVDKNGKNSDGTNETTPCASRSSSSRRWIFLKEFLYRSKSEGGRTESHNNNNKFWGSLSFSPVKDKKMQQQSVNNNNNQEVKKKSMNKNGGGKNRTAKMNSPSAHEIHYTAKRAQAEEMRKKTYLPYRQGLFGCLGFSSKSYGAINGFARALNTVSSR